MMVDIGWKFYSGVVTLRLRSFSYKNQTFWLKFTYSHMYVPLPYKVWYKVWWGVVCVWALCLVVKLRMDQISTETCIIHLFFSFFFLPKWAELTKYLDKSDIIRYKPCPQFQRERRNIHMKKKYDKKESRYFLDRCCFSYLNLTE